MTLVILMVLVIGVGALSQGLLFDVMAERKSVTHQETSQIALDVAETGIVRAEMEIRSLVDPDGDGIGTISGSYGGGLYTVTATQDPVSAERWRLVAVGTCGLSTRRVEVGVRRRGRESHVEGLYSTGELDFGGSSQSDAYDSREGSYADQAVNSDGDGLYARTGGDIGSGRDIVLHGSSSVVRGNAVPGPLHQVLMNGTPVVTGDVVPRLRELELPHTAYSEFLAAYQTNKNDSLLGTNALGLAASQDLDAVTSSALRALAGTDVDDLESFDVLSADDRTLDGMIYDQLLAERYVADLAVDPTTLLKPTREAEEYYEKWLLDGGVLPIDADPVVIQPELDDDEASNDSPDDTTTATPGAPSYDSAAAAHPGRISYDAYRRELRATAGAAVVLDGGTYFFSNIKLLGRAYLVVRGPSTIYVTGELDLGGGAILSESGRPSDLRILAHPYPLPPNDPPDTTSVKIRGGGDVAAVIYGPEADVTIGGGDDLYGSVVGRQITVVGSVRFHYDTALSVEASRRGATLERLYWRELSAPPR